MSDPTCAPTMPLEPLLLLLLLLLLKSSRFEPRHRLGVRSRGGGGNITAATATLLRGRALPDGTFADLGHLNPCWPFYFSSGRAGCHHSGLCLGRKCPRPRLLFILAVAAATAVATVRLLLHRGELARTSLCCMLRGRPLCLTAAAAAAAAATAATASEEALGPGRRLQRDP